MTDVRNVFTAQTPVQARLLQDITYLGTLSRLLEGEASAGEVANHTGQTVKQAHHKLTRLLNAGLIGLAGERTRAGRAVKVYRAAAPEYRVPFHLTDAATLGELIQVSHQPMLDTHYRALARLAGGGRDLRLFRNNQGRTAYLLAEHPDDALVPPHTTLVSAFLSYRLTPQTAEQLEERLAALTAWLGEQNVPRTEEGQDYLLGLFLAPGKPGE